MCNCIVQLDCGALLFTLHNVGSMILNVSSRLFTLYTQYLTSAHSASSPGKISSLVSASKAAKLTARLYDTLEDKRLGPQYASKRSSTAEDAQAAPPATKRPAAAADSAQNGVKKMRWDQPSPAAAAPAPAPAAPAAGLGAAGAKGPLTPQQVSSS